ncbi:T9SS type B sorting domain-containing protein [Flavobacteriaceae bacterium MHTCC 0001]
MAQDPNDCVNAVVGCGNSTINLDVNGSGKREFPNSCQSNENNSVWLQITLITNGTLGFTLRPNSASISEDYDFFVFGPNATCGNLGNTIRCSTTNPLAANQGNNLTGMNSTEADTSEGPGVFGNSFVKWLDVKAGETYYIVIDRPIGNSGFSLEWTGSATFSSPPTNEAPTSGVALNIQSCDVTMPFDDGFTEFDLEVNTSIIKGSQSNITVTYHETESDANIGINPITGPYLNTSSPQIIHARITNDITQCFSLTQFNLSTELGPNFTPPIDYSICDNANDGDNTNGRAIFTLSSKNAEILNGQNPSDFNITYHSTATGAEFNTPSTLLPDTYYNNTAFNEEVFMRIEDTTNPDCASTSPLKLIVNPLPTSINHTMLQCDEDGNADGLTLFNLNEANGTLTNNNNNLLTKFYADVARTDEIINPESYPNISNPQIIYVEVIDSDSLCSIDAELTISVSLTDALDTFLDTCDDDGIEDGFHQFNLNNADTAIINGLPTGLKIAYYQSYDDALTEQNPLNNTYTNTTTFNQLVYARVENNNDCYGISEVELIVTPLPDIKAEEFTHYCTNFFPNTISINAGLNDTDISNFTFNWNTGEQTYAIDVNASGVYDVIVTNNSTNCSKIRTITVDPSNIAVFENIKVTDGSTNNIINVSVSGDGIYQYALLNDNRQIYRDYQNENIFANITPGIYTVVVKDIENNCGTVENIVSVIGFPKFFTPNNDGRNDTWQVYGVSNMFQPKTKIKIFNRYGKLLKELQPLGEGWNGLLNGELLPPDDYWFSVKLQDGREFKNHFTLKL